MIDYHLGVSRGFHDAGLALVDGEGRILSASHAERYSGVKNDSELHDEQLKETFFDVPSCDVYHNLRVNYYEHTARKNLRRIRAAQIPRGVGPLKKQLAWHCNSKHPMKSWEHHLSHAACAFQTSPYDKSTILVVDAIGEWDTTSIWSAWYDAAGDAQYKKLWSQKYPHSIGLFYTAFTQRIGLRPLEDEYVLMGMSSFEEYNNPVVVEDMEGDFVDDYFSVRFKRNLHRGVGGWGKEYTDGELAFGAQRVTEHFLANLWHRCREFDNTGNLCYAGGVALNCVANQGMHTYFDNVWIPPNPGDAGAALGAAALGYGKKLQWRDPYLGTDLGELHPNQVVDALLANGVVGVAAGRAEWGPRALGNRSLLGDPRLPNLKDRVNEIKKRQKFRPFSPAIMSEAVKAFTGEERNFDYMQYAVETTGIHDAVQHVDGTSRIQSVKPDCRSQLRQILEAWYERTGVPYLLNTSLNIRGKPMVNSRADAEDFTQEYGVSVITGK